MKEATIQLSISKEHTYFKYRITPIEAMLLVAEHHKSLGDNPVKVEKDSIKDVMFERDIEETYKDGGVEKTRTVKKKVSRSTDEECDRLKGIYDYRKVEALMSKVRDMPETYEQAIERGLKITLPRHALSETKGI